MKRLLYSLVFVCALLPAARAQVKIGNNANTLNPWSVLELESTNRGLLLPRLTHLQMQALGTVAPDGMLVYNIDNKALYIQRNSQFVRVADTTKTISFPYTAIVNTVGDGFNLTNNYAGANSSAISANATGGTGISASSISGNAAVFSSSTGNALVTLAGNVGLGTNATAYQLDVNGRMRVRYNGATAGIWLNKAANTEASFIGQVNDSTFGIWDGTNGGWRFAFNHTNNFFGIGTATPKYPLVFANTIGDKISLYGGSASGTTNHYGLGIQGSLMQLFVPSSTEDIAFGTGRSGSFTENMRIKGTGDVGIGTSTPNHPLTVVTSSDGIVNKTGNVEVGFFTNSGAAFVQTYSNHNLNFTTNNGGAQMTLAITGNLGIGTTSPNSPLSFPNTVGNKISLWGTASNQYGLGVQGSLLQLYTDNSAGDIGFGYGSSTNFTETARMKGSGIFQFPAVIGKKITLYPGSNGDAGFGVFGNELRLSSDYSGADITLGYDTRNGAFTERMRIKGSGNVGIGTNAPAALLEVAGKTKANQGAGDDAALEINGGIKVSGSNRAVFQLNMGTLAGNPNYFQINSGGLITDYYRITTPLIANDPNAMLVATPQSSRLSFPFWVGYDASNTIGGGFGQWYIVEPRDSNGVGGFTNNMRFNILIVKQ